MNISERNMQITCPFFSHKGGRESSSSFTWYPDTNTYNCFGCHVGHFGSDFVSEMDGISKAQAAIKILGWFGDDVDESLIIELEDPKERLDIMLEFAKIVKEFRQSHYEEKDYENIEDICSIFDKINEKHEKMLKPLSNLALRRMVENLTKVIE